MKHLPFHLPEDFEPPEAAEEDKVEVLATIRILGNGMADLLALDGKPIPEPRRSFIDAVDAELNHHGPRPSASN